jgi:hypothetical protein
VFGHRLLNSNFPVEITVISLSDKFRQEDIFKYISGSKPLVQ